MVRGIALFAVVLLVGGLASGPALPDAALTLTGDVHILTGPDGKTTAVTVDASGQAVLPDGIVDHAFRLQHKSSQTLEYDGPATISYIKGRLTVLPEDGEPWVFTVATAADIAAPAAQSQGAAIVVMGLSHHWGKAIHRRSVEVTAGLLSAGCSLDGGDPSCENCDSGGPGAEGCGIDCDDGWGCSVSCGSGSMACCSCAIGCRCCPPRAEKAATGVAR